MKEPRQTNFEYNSAWEIVLSTENKRQLPAVSPIGLCAIRREVTLGTSHLFPFSQEGYSHLKQMNAACPHKTQQK